MIDIVFKNHTTQKSLSEKFFKEILEIAARKLKLKSKIEVSINLVGEEKIKELNKKYRHKNKLTDVLSFPLENGSGDIFICLSIAKNDAKQENIDMERKLAQLTVHGFLHLLGHDHEKSDQDAKKMFKLEKKILNRL